MSDILSFKKFDLFVWCKLSVLIRDLALDCRGAGVPLVYDAFQCVFCLRGG